MYRKKKHVKISHHFNYPPDAYIGPPNGLKLIPK